MINRQKTKPNGNPLGYFWVTIWDAMCKATPDTRHQTYNLRPLAGAATGHELRSFPSPGIEFAGAYAANLTATGGEHQTPGEENGGGK